jgi:hypothetical protein
MRFAVLVVAVGLCSCASTKLPSTQTAAEQFSVLGSREKVIARNFYDLGSGDAIRRLYWAQRASPKNSQKRIAKRRLFFVSSWCSTR